MNYKYIKCAAFLWMAVLLLMASSTWAQQASTLTRGDNAILIGPGDLLNILVFDTPELSGPGRVTEDGDLSVPLIGIVHIAGLSPAQAGQLLRRRLIDGEFVKDPQVTVLITEYAAQGITVAGEVVKPGIYPIIGRKRLCDVISMASGLTATAGTRVVITHRGRPAVPLTVAFKDAGGNVKGENTELEPGDTVVIERAGVVFVLGDVTKPGGFVMDRDRMSVLEALALAQGPTKTASITNARLLRRTPAGIEQSPLLLKRLLSAKTPDVMLQSGDVVYVPSSMTKGVLQGGVQGIMQSAVGAAIYTFSR